ncbi:MAG: YbdK family carboxylate-amine ligase [Gaiellaceae bacterium MAG52_C11]|nr:YbdK family carboxylate-amine ligase [Candidatus Gaiellasilicea maunaloa]
MLLDPETCAAAPGVERLLGPPGVKTELFACLVETNTPVCESASEALAELVRLRGVVRVAAEREGLAVAATGSHPFSAPEEQEIVPEPRYLALLAERPAARRQLVCGLHVHVGMASLEHCLETLEFVLPWLPAVLAFSLNSPYLAGEDTGLLSARADRLLELPRAGPPPLFESGEGWAEAIERAGGDYTRIWWDVRPHPSLGTLEVRMADQPTSVHRSAAIAALVQALCASAEPVEPADRGAYLVARAAAAAGRAPTDELLALVEPATRELGTWELVEPLRGPPEAQRQLDVGRRDGLVAVAADLVARSR